MPVEIRLVALAPETLHRLSGVHGGDDPADQDCLWLGGRSLALSDASRLGDDWRTRIPPDLAALAQAWRDPMAWRGTTQAGGLELPGEVAGLVVLDELVIHGWDVARASGQTYDCDPTLLMVVHRFVAQFSGTEHEAEREGLFGPVVEVPDDAPLLDRVIGLSGRDTAWSPTTPTVA